MNRKIFDYLEIAGKIAYNGSESRCYLLGCVGIRNDGAMVKSFNGTSEVPNRMIHSEYRVAKKLDAGATIYVARVRMLDGEFGMSKPCKDCMKVLQSRKVKRVYYTIGPNEFGVITF